MQKSWRPVLFLVVSFIILFPLFLNPINVLAQSRKVTKTSKFTLTLPALNLLRIENQIGNIKISAGQNTSIVMQAIYRNNSSVSVKEKEIYLEKESDQIYLKISPTQATSPIDIQVLVPEGTNLRLFSNTGSIDVSLAVNSLVANTNKGSISLNLPEKVDADISLASSSGIVRAEKLLKTATNSANSPTRSLYKRLGKGGTVISLTSEQGNITLNNNYVKSNNVTQTTPTDVNSTPASISINKLPSDSTTSTKPSPKLDNDSASIVGSPKPNKITKPELRRNDGTNSEVTTNNSSIPSSNDSKDDNNDDVIRIESELVTLNASAVNSIGQPITNLRETEFLLYEDGIEQEIVHFQSVNTPFNLVLLIDLSGSLKERLKLIRKSAWSFIQATRPEDKVAIITFSGSARLICPLTNDRELLRQKIESIKDADGGTNFYDALERSLLWLLQQAQSERNSIVIMTDGVDNALPGVPGRGSLIGFNELLAKIQESDTIVFPIYINTEEEVINETGLDVSEAYYLSREQLKTLSDATGGSIFYANRLEDLSGCYEKVAAELRTIYSLGYYPTNSAHDGGFRKIRLKVKKDNVKVKTRRGYYAKKS
ncbi:MAG: VWA domain-containing protein [Blastocatellia bacterium]